MQMSKNQAGPRPASAKAFGFRKPVTKESQRLILTPKKICSAGREWEA
jgi:hypothetical protein